MEQLFFDVNTPIDVHALDAIVEAFFFTTSVEQRDAAGKTLTALQEHPEAWTQVVPILQRTSSVKTKFLTLQILENVIKFRWNALPVEQREGIKQYVSETIVQLSSDEVNFRSQQLYVNKLNKILVEVLKHDWPNRWPSFVPDLIGVARTSETICENCMYILQMLSDDVFNFSEGDLTQHKTREMKNAFNNEVQMIFELCTYVLTASQRRDLIIATLTTLRTFLDWIPIGYIFETNVLEILLKLLMIAPYRNASLRCLIEVAALPSHDYFVPQYAKLFSLFMTELQSMVPLPQVVSAVYLDSSSDDQELIKNLALFFTSFFQARIGILETDQESMGWLMLGLEYLLNISYIDENEIFRICVDYWRFFVASFDVAEARSSGEGEEGEEEGRSPLEVDGLLNGGMAEQNYAAPPSSPLEARKFLFRDPLSKLRLLMISRMAKPEEVMIVEDENGNVVREAMKDNDVLYLHKTMQETLYKLSSMDPEDTEKLMLRSLSAQMPDLSRTSLNSLCWAIGCTSGSMKEEQENRFLVTVIRDLLNLCEFTRGKDNKAVIASCIMYVVGQYPRFLRAHWKFLKTVVNKLFEFMRETHPGVQDMACDTFLKIVKQCKRRFVSIQQEDRSDLYLVNLLSDVPKTSQDLEPHHVLSFYESLGMMIEAELNPDTRNAYLQILMGPCNQKWRSIIDNSDHSTLTSEPAMKAILQILQVNTSVATSLGEGFLPQFSLMIGDSLAIYRTYSEAISQYISQGGPFAAKSTLVKLPRSVKREVLKMVEAFIDKSKHVDEVGSQIIMAMREPILGDYTRNVPDARESEVLSLYAAIINKFQHRMLDEVPIIFEAVFDCTLKMLTTNFEDYPEHRIKFFSLLKSIATHCFPALLKLPPTHLKLAVDSVIWAFRHTERNVAETGLSLTLEILHKFEASEFCNQFHQTYYMQIESAIFGTLTDTFHKPGFHLHAQILQHLFLLVDSGKLTQPLWDLSTAGPGAFQSNEAYVRDFTLKLLSSSFPNMSPKEVNGTVVNLFDSKGDLETFKGHLKDFLVLSKVFSEADTSVMGQ